MQYGNYRAGLIAVLALLAGSAEAQKAIESGLRTPNAYLDAEINNGMVTLKARDVTVKRLVEEIAHRGAIRLMLNTALDERVTLEFRQLPLQQAVDRILRGRNYALRYLPPPCSTVNPGARAQGTLWVFSDDAHPAEAAADDTGIVRIAVPDPAGSGNDEATVLLAAALGDWDASVREEAVDVLGDLSGEAAIPLLEQALVDPDSDVQEAAIAALADIGGEQAARALATALNDDNTALRENTVDALGDIGGKTATRLLQRALADQERLVRDAAAEHLAELLNQQD